MAKVKTVAFVGMTPLEVTVEAQISPGLASFSIVGLPDKAVAEAKERVRSTLYSIGLGFPAKRVIVNMAPADMPKIGAHFDLPIAIAILCAIGILDWTTLHSIIIGELGLDGSINYVSGAICAAIFANANNLSIICPKACATEVMWSGNQSIIAVGTITQLINHLTGKAVISTIFPEKMLDVNDNYAEDIADVHGQIEAKRALEIAACGKHNLLMIGSPGSGKSMLALRLRTILPKLTPKEALDTTCIYSLAGMLPKEGIIYNPPYRAPHYSTSLVAMVGGGFNPKPGEVSLANNGILFLDEFPEFQRKVIESLRQPLENRTITVSRAKEHITYSADFQLVAAMNQCKCGYYGNTKKQCNRTPNCTIEYTNKISGPILDRFDIILHINNIHHNELFSRNNQQITSAEIREKVKQVREIQILRANKHRVLFNKLNGQINNRYLDKIVSLSLDSQQVLQKALDSSVLSTRGIHKILKVARTIADMRQSENIEDSDIKEALRYKFGFD